MGLILDLFAGGGGASVGIEAALGRFVDLAVNHDEVAIAVHAANHPQTHHDQHSVWDVDPAAFVRGRPVDLLWASPDCKHFSSAKGSKPLDNGIRSLAWVVVRWAAAVRPRVLVVENVREFLSWGPLNAAGRPCRRLDGEEFQRWVSALELQGYRVEWRILDASEFGAPTKRLRLFVVARRDGLPIRWPEPTHGEGREPLRTAAEIIDWSLPCPSIFASSEEILERYGIRARRPLAEKTQARIAEGLRRFVLEAEDPFIAPAGFGATLIQTGYGEREGQAPRAPGLSQPLGTVVAGGSKHALVTAWMVKHYAGVYGQRLDAPAATITATDHHALGAATLIKVNHGGEGHRGQDLREPLTTVTASRRGHALVRAFLAKYYGSGGQAQSLRDPLHTITARARLGLVTVEGEDYAITDIGMRMLEPHELLAAQFGRFAAGYSLAAARTKKDKTRLVGNSVCPEVAEAIVAAQFAAVAQEAAA